MIGNYNAKELQAETKDKPSKLELRVISALWLPFNGLFITYSVSNVEFFIYTLNMVDNVIFSKWKMTC